MTSLVVPTYNPGDGVTRTWAAMRTLLRSRPDPWEVLFVCDGCTDGTPARLAALHARRPDPRVRLLGYPVNRGKGYAVRTGLAAAAGRYRLFTDFDLAFLDALPRAADALHTGAALVMASRTHPASEVVAPTRLIPYLYRRRLQSRAFSVVVRRLLPISATDSQAGLKGLSAAAAEAILPRLGCDGFAFDCELLTAAARLGLPVAEVPVRVRVDSRTTTTGPGAAVRMVGQLWRIRRRWQGAGPPPAVLPPLPRVAAA